MDTIYIVKYSDETVGRPFSTREKAVKYAISLMGHFGGLWDELPCGCIFQRVYESKSSFRRPSQTGPLRIFIEKAYLDDSTLPIVGVVGTRKDKNNQTVHTLGIPRNYQSITI